MQKIRKTADVYAVSLNFAGGGQIFRGGESESDATIYQQAANLLRGLGFVNSCDEARVNLLVI